MTRLGMVMVGAVIASLGWGDLAPALAQATHWTSDGEVAQSVLEEVLAPIDEAVRAYDVPLLALRVVDESGSFRTVEPMAEAIGNFFWDAGYEIQVLGPKIQMEPGAWTLALTVDAATVDIPAKRNAFLGLGKGKWLRRAAVSLRGSLQDESTGRWYWKGAPAVAVEEWVAADADARLRENRPAWAGAAPLPPVDKGVAWWEKSLVVGMLGGVMTLYFSGAN